MLYQLIKSVHLLSHTTPKYNQTTFQENAQLVMVYHNI